ncbi:MAG TPA: hypothetical protein VGU66_02145, partial [Candidatus Elarobacter sp.]|nr:hypothetical protein [Candidatus Elarobacter sp.]
MKRLVVAASMALAFFVMPASAHAVDLVECVDCGSGPPPTQPGCGALQDDRHGGNVGRWSSYMNGSFANYEFDYDLTSPGTWNVNYHFDIYDNRGVKVGSFNVSSQ